MNIVHIYRDYLPNEILIKIRDYLGPHKIAKIFTDMINKIEIVSKDEPFQDLMYHFYRHYELYDDEPDFSIRWTLIEENACFKDWRKMYKWWYLWEGILFNKLFTGNNS
tara:strand:+ start:42 stop:368 length:327 start_codon:yes stop_codon:yes gene_type:complete